MSKKRALWVGTAVWLVGLFVIPSSETYWLVPCWSAPFWAMWFVVDRPQSVWHWVYWVSFVPYLALGTAAFSGPAWAFRLFLFTSLLIVCVILVRNRKRERSDTTDRAPHPEGDQR